MTLAFFTHSSAQTVFRIAALNQTNPQMILADGVTGDDGSAFAVSSSSVFFTGDGTTGRFNLTDLGGGAGLPRRYTTLIGDVQTGKVFTLATTPNTPIVSNTVVTATHIIELDAETGALTTNTFELSAPITINSATGFFSGAGRMLIDNRNSVYEISPLNGAVTVLAASPQNINPYLSETDNRYWGVAEFFGGASYTVYRRAQSNDIVRTRLSDGATSIVQTFPNLGDMAQFAVSPTLNRWYYHAEGGIFFGGGGNTETVGFADAVIELSNPGSPVVTTVYQNQVINEDQPTPLTLDADVRDNFSDPNNDPLTFLAVSNNPNVAVAIVGNELRLTSLAANFSATVVISVTATDNRDGSATNSFNLVVGAVNDIPTVTNPLIDQNVYANSPLPLTLDNDLDDNFADVEGSLAGYTATSDNPNVSVGLLGTRGTILQLTAIASNFMGTANITVTARDSDNATVSDTFQLRVLPAPTAANDLFTITSLGTTGANVIDANGVAGDDGSAFAVGTSGVLFTGDTATGSFSPADLSGGVRFAARYTTLSSDLRSGKIYSFGTSATAPITVNTIVTATHLLEINAANGAVMNAVQLSQPIVITNYNNDLVTGIFAGFRRIIVSNGTYVYSVDPTNGTVANLGASPAMNAALSESDARFWGVAEFDGTNTYLVYRQNGQSIVRTRVGDGATTIIQTFTNLGETAQFGISLTRNRWYYHSEGNTQFATGIEEQVGYADATFNFASGNNTAPVVTAPLADASLDEDSATPFVLDGNLTNNFADADGDLLAFQAESDNAGVTISIIGSNQLIVSSLAANFTGTVNVTVTARDGRGGLVSDTLALTIVPVDNDPPVNNVPGAQTILQNHPLYFYGANRISISDPDAGNNSVRTTLNVNAGTLTLGTTPNDLTITGDNTNHIVLTGGIADINLALNNLRYTPPTSYAGAATLTIITDDQGNSGPGAGQTDTDTVTINVIADSDLDGVPDSSDACPNTPANASVNQYGCSADQSPTLANQVLWLTGDGDTRDFSGNNYNAAASSGAGFALGKVGQAFDLDGTDDLITFPVPNEATGNNPRTAEFWFNARTGQATANRALFYYGTFNGRGAFGISIDDTPLSGTNSLRLKFIDSVDTVRFDTGIAPGNYTHLAVTYDGSATLKIYVNGNLNQTFTLPEPLNSTNAAGSFGNAGNYFGGQIDEFSLYSRALTIDEIRAVVSVGTRGKLKERTTAAGSNVTTQIAGATVNFPTVNSTGTTRETPLDGSTLPTLPTGSNSNALFLDVSTTVNYSGSPTVCFNVPSFSAAQTANAAVYHLENNSWVNHTGTRGGTNICTGGLPGFSPFAIVPFAPTAANIFVSGKVLVSDGRGLTNAVVTLTDGAGNVRTTRSTSFGYFHFPEVAAGGTYILNVASKHYQFVPQVITVTENVSDLRLTAF